MHRFYRHMRSPARKLPPRWQNVTRRIRLIYIRRVQFFRKIPSGALSLLCSGYDFSEKYQPEYHCCFEAGMLFPGITRSDSIPNSGWYIFTRRTSFPGSGRYHLMNFIPASLLPKLLSGYPCLNFYLPPGILLLQRVNL